MGRSSAVSAPVALRPSLMIAPVSGEAPSSDGFTSEDGLVVGTYVHGLLENVALRRALLRRLAARKGVRLAEPEYSTTIDDALDALATAVRQNIYLDAVAEIAGLALDGS